MTELRNRGTQVATLTSGAGWVFTEKDLNECMQKFCKSVLKYGEKELKSRSDLLAQKESHYRRLVYIKDQQATYMQSRIENQGKNLENLINAKLFEKGNQLIYQLDCTSRLLILFKQTMFGLETEIRNRVIGEQHQKFKLQKDELDNAIERFKDYKKHIEGIVRNDFESSRAALEREMTVVVAKAMEIGPHSTYRAQPRYLADGKRPQQSAHPRQSSLIQLGGGYGQSVGSLGADGRLKLAKDVGSLPGTLVPPGFRHEAHCVCYRPDPTRPNPTMKYAEIDMMDQQ